MRRENWRQLRDVVFNSLVTDMIRLNEGGFDDGYYFILVNFNSQFFSDFYVLSAVGKLERFYVFMSEEIYDKS